VDPRYVEEILPLARRLGIGTIGFKTFGAGKLLGDTSGYNQPLKERPRGKFSSGSTDAEAAPSLPHLSVEECLHYTLTTLTLNPDVTLLGMSFPNEQDAVMKAYRTYRPLSEEALAATRLRAAKAVEGKGRCWWNPA
jgi:1-deoxyxylulose-5-phosphate synthase